MNDFQMYEEGRKEAEAKQCTIYHVVSSFKCRKCGSENIKERSGYKVCYDCGEHH